MASLSKPQKSSAKVPYDICNTIDGGSHSNLNSHTTMTNLNAPTDSLKF